MHAYLVLLACTAVSMGIGMAYWGPLVGRLFMKVAYTNQGRKPNMDPSYMKLCFTSTTIAAIVENYLLYRGLQIVGVSDLSGILVAAFILCVEAGYDLNHVFWEGRPWHLIPLRLGFHTIALFTNAAIMTRLL